MQRTGPGAEAIRRAVESLDSDRVSLVVLFGVAGALGATEPAPPIGAVVDAETGERWTPSVIPPGPCSTIAGVAEPVWTADTKRDLAARTGADLVDCESHAFARACVAAGLRWAIVRGVSDGPETALPPESARWVDANGATRPGRVMLDLLRRPALTPVVLRLGRTTSRALCAAAARLDAMLDAAGATIGRDADG